MNTADTMINLEINEFPQEGLWLIFPDAKRIAFVRDDIERLAQAYWENPEKIPPEVKQMKDFQPCDHCPEKGHDVLCRALRPLLPFLEDVDYYQSYDSVIAVFRKSDSSVLHVSHTTMQEALRYVAILSMIHYCEMSVRYSNYFRDVDPLMPSKKIAERVYSNIYMDHRGNLEEMTGIITQFKHEVLESAECLVRRLNILCRNDAFVNAFVNTNLIMEYLNFVEHPSGRG